jgi:hypothetical protein
MGKPAASAFFSLMLRNAGSASRASRNATVALLLRALDTAEELLTSPDALAHVLDPEGKGRGASEQDVGAAGRKLLVIVTSIMANTPPWLEAEAVCKPPVVFRVLKLLRSMTGAVDPRARQAHGAGQASGIRTGGMPYGAAKPVGRSTGGQSGRAAASAGGGPRAGYPDAGARR